jgi:hypothetical protein
MVPRLEKMTRPQASAPEGTEMDGTILDDRAVNLERNKSRICSQAPPPPVCVAFAPCIDEVQFGLFHRRRPTIL